jgi:spermidine synthase
VVGTISAKRAAEELIQIKQRLIVASALMLFLELTLIRWLGANIVHLGYFSNFVLLGSFLGIGLGFLIARHTWSLWPASLPLLAALVVAVRHWPVTIQREGADVIYFTSLSLGGPPAWLVLPLTFVAVALIVAGPAEIVGRCFVGMPALDAYRLDLVGSLIGILAFATASFLGASSLVWGMAICAVWLVLADQRRRRILMSLATVVVLVALYRESSDSATSWSPYYKVTTADVDGGGNDFLTISANGVPHQLMAPAEWKLENGEEIYEAPYQRLPENPLGDVLIVGAGSGSDVAIALRKGAEHVDAVEIDPEILELGVERHPDRPYQSDRVTIHRDDGRAFLERTDRRYDLILFALPDSLTLVNGASQIRLESFLFTEQAMNAVRDRLTPDGAFAMYNYYREPWLIDRLAETARGEFGHSPCVDLFDGAQAVITVAVEADRQQCARDYQPLGAVVSPATDNRPFLYFRGDGFPGLYLVTLLGILLASVIGVRAVGGPLRNMRPYVDLFFMGAAFLLVETKNVATFALLFGTTWFVNALVFAGVLAVVLAAVEVTRRRPTPPLPALFAGVGLSLAVAYVVPPDLLLELPFAARLVAAIGLAFIPIFLANVAFAQRFARAADSRAAFGINLLGAMVGGCLEYSALILGYQGLLLLAGGLYAIAFLAVPRLVPAR